MPPKVKSVKVEKLEGIPTHKAVTVEVQEKDRNEKTWQLRKLQSLKKLFGRNIEEKTEA